MSEDAKYVPTKYDSVFWIDVDRIKPNPHQPRRDFTEEGLKALADSIRQYGVLQPLTVTRNEREKPEGGLETEYELIAGERRLRASKLAGLQQVPAVIRAIESNLAKLELAIIENLQREDLNAIDRAHALQKLVNEFGISHSEAAAKVGKSREYVSNSLRLLTLPEHLQNAIVEREITEGHARPLLTLQDRPQEQETLFREIILKKLSVRAAERIARSIAQERVRSYHRKSPEMVELEKSLTEQLGTRVIIESNAEDGGRLLIDFFSNDDLTQLAEALLARQQQMEAAQNAANTAYPNTTLVTDEGTVEEIKPEDDSTESDDDLYSIKNFTV